MKKDNTEKENKKQEEMLQENEQKTEVKENELNVTEEITEEANKEEKNKKDSKEKKSKKDKKQNKEEDKQEADEEIDEEEDVEDQEETSTPKREKSEIEKKLEEEKEALEEKKKIRNNTIRMIIVLALIVIVVVVIFFVKGLDTTTTEDHKFYQYFAGKKVEYTGSLTFTRKEGITELAAKDKKVMLDSTPVYYGDVEGKAMFPEDMAIIYPKQNGLMNKVNHFSSVIKEGESTYLELNTTTSTNKKLVENALLYDGSDLYFFLENTTITVNGQDYEVTPLSYVIVRYRENVEIYNKEKDEYTVIETPDQDVYAKTADYTINMSIDALQAGEKEQLLIKSIDKLQNIEENVEK
ncbi:MAG TPA: hypothetical protein IAB70_05340 [Candidatus Merdicola faecigallinarum]|uniref:Uncharacterized protein n=1 Tax=Candidatus Merdicola faecigallinarum TaxID=2840862 RepID=A0A9D1S999_9FIRM|nr:hypothetical protein [Candidatus Merdicola faecigallinarum]